MNLKWVSIFFLILIYFQLMFETCPELSVEGNERHPCLILLLYSSHHRARSSVLDKRQQTMLSTSSAGWFKLQSRSNHNCRNDGYEGPSEGKRIVRKMERSPLIDILKG